jgi:fatty-acyl-CoA synthase
MQGTMMNYPLFLPHILERAGKLFPSREIVSRLPDCSLHRHTYRDFHQRARSLAEALLKAGLQRGDRVGTLMWNHYIHLEAYFGIPSAGGVVHTLNLRLSPSDLAYIVTHARDRFLIVDDVLLPLFEKFQSSVSLERVIVAPLTGKPIPSGYESYEDFLQTAGGSFQHLDLDENEAAAMCYTSGTTGFPKGVAYSHRSLVLHATMTALPDLMGYSQCDTVLPVVPMFHANAWGMPFATTMIGCKQVFPGPHLDAENLLDLLASEKITFTAGVPTVALAIVEALEKSPKRWKLEPHIRMLVGGSAPPESLIQRLDRQGIEIIQGWGLTESSPIASVSKLKSHMEDWCERDKCSVRSKAGMPAPFVDMRIVGDTGVAPCDGVSMGEIELRGPWVAASYYDLPEERNKWTKDGWFRTGDVGTIDAEGYLKITDRTKDLIKSGGEWISSVDLENAIVAYPDVREAAVIAVPHPKWQERPFAVVVLREGAKVTSATLCEFLSAKFAKWQLPAACVFVDQLPHTSTGKLLKAELRKQYQDWNWEN